MAENDINPRPMGDADITTPPGSTSFQPAVPLKDQGVEFEPALGSAGASAMGDSIGGAMGGDTGGGTGGGAGVKQQLTDGAGKLQSQAGDKARQFADMGKERAAGLLEQLATMLTDAAGQVDGKLGAQYGTYARNAADTVQGFSQQVRDQDLDQLMDQGRELVRKSPAMAVGAAAAVGFVLSRLVQSGIDAERR
jgi:ElaB/YqjD/DUF883 family membrane-anchored ribosome-binding protein